MHGRLIAGEYRVGKRLGKGGFGTTYRGLHVASKTPVAIKVEHAHVKRSTLEHERRLYEQLHPCPGLPAIEWHGVVDGNRVLIMELLGCSLERVRQQLPEKRVPRVTVLEMGQQMLRLLQRLHQQRIVHRDIKPDNIVLGRAHHRDRLFVVDLGLAKRASLDLPSSGAARKKLAGSARYCSIFTHDGLPQTYRDDLEGLAYTLLHLLRGSLPWQGIEDPEKPEKPEKEASPAAAAIPDDEGQTTTPTTSPPRQTSAELLKAAKIAKYRLIGEAKRALQPEHVECPALRQLLRTARTLRHGEMPPYDKLLAQFHAPPPAAALSAHTDPSPPSTLVGTPRPWTPN